MDLVTGGTGLIGSHLLLELALRRRPLRAIKRPDSDTQMMKQVFQYYRPEEGMALFSGIEWVDAELHDIEALREAVRGVDRIFHSAGLVSYDPRDGELLTEVNAEGTQALVDLALEQGVKAFGHVSSTAALGKAAKGEPVDERAKWQVSHRNNAYSISKYAAEREVWRAREEGLAAVIVNPCIVLGPGDPGRSSTTLLGAVAKGTPFYPPGANAFIDVRDVATPLVELMDDPAQEGERFVLIGEHRSFGNVMRLIAEELKVKAPRIRAGKGLLELGWRSEATLRALTGRKPMISKDTARNGMKRMHYSSAKAERSFNFSPRSVEEAIHNSCEFYRILQKEKAS